MYLLYPKLVTIVWRIDYSKSILVFDSNYSPSPQVVTEDTIATEEVIDTGNSAWQVRHFEEQHQIVIIANIIIPVIGDDPARSLLQQIGQDVSNVQVRIWKVFGVELNRDGVHGLCFHVRMAASILI
jgi:hypothetical protein